MSKHLKIYFLVPYPLKYSPGQRFRFEHFLPYFSSQKIDYTVSPFMNEAFYKILCTKKNFLKMVLTILGYCKRCLDIIKIIFGKYDLVFIYRETTPLRGIFFEKILTVCNKKIIFDFDDAIFLPPIHTDQKWIKSLKNPSKVKEIVQLSNLVLVGNQYLKDFATQYNQQVEIFPTLINTDFHIPKKENIQNKKNSLCIGWTGSYFTLPYLYTLKFVFKKLSNQYPYLYFKIIGASSFATWEGIPIKTIPWSLRDEIQQLQEIDIGLMPLTHDPFSQGKCGFKALQYMSLEIPAVCSPVGISTTIIQDGINGFLCHSEEEWIQKLQLLIENEDLRKKLGKEGRKTVIQFYSVEQYKNTFFKHIQNLI